MDIGIFGIGGGVSADPKVLLRVARHADANGMSTLWSAGHPFRVRKVERAYPYSSDGVVPVPPEASSYEQFVTLAYLAAVTDRVRLGTAVLVTTLLHPLELAKSVASLDDLCSGRFDLGIGVGWMKEEFDVLGEPWRDRARRTVRGLEIAKRIWSEDSTSLDSEDWSFPEVLSFPKPVQHPHPPIFFGGASEPALRRIGEYGDGWCSFCDTPDEVARGRAQIEEYARAAGRTLSLRVSACPGYADLTVDDLKRYREAGVDEIAVPLPPDCANDLDGHLGRLTDRLVEPARSL